MSGGGMHTYSGGSLVVSSPSIPDINNGNTINIIQGRVQAQSLGGRPPQTIMHDNNEHHTNGIQKVYFLFL